MDINLFSENLSCVNWHNNESVPISLLNLAEATQEAESNIAFAEKGMCDLLLNPKVNHEVLASIGNDHSGSYYPIAKQALPFIIQVSKDSRHVVARNCAINTLIDLYHFCAICQDGSDPNELEEHVKSTIKSAISSNQENYVQFALDNPGNKSLIEGLLQIVDEPDDDECFEQMVESLDRMIEAQGKKLGVEITRNDLF